MARTCPDPNHSPTLPLPHTCPLCGIHTMLVPADGKFPAGGPTLGEVAAKDAAIARLTAALEKSERKAAQTADRFMAPIVCLCGSTKFKQAFIAENARLTGEGSIVLSVGFFGHHQRIEPTPEQKVALDALHKQKINLCDWVWVIDIGGYVGPSTRSEIEHALANGIPVRYLSEEFPEYVEPVDEVAAALSAARAEVEAWKGHVEALVRWGSIPIVTPAGEDGSRAYCGVCGDDWVNGACPNAACALNAARLALSPPACEVAPAPAERMCMNGCGRPVYGAAVECRRDDCAVEAWRAFHPMPPTGSASPPACEACAGSGEVFSDAQADEETATCASCSGTGRKPGEDRDAALVRRTMLECAAVVENVAGIATIEQLPLFRKASRLRALAADSEAVRRIVGGDRG